LGSHKGGGIMPILILIHLYLREGESDPYI
jgi:hypothetical protein